MRYIRINILILSLLFCHAYNAQAGQIMTWKDCVREAAKNHPELISSGEKIKQARADREITLSALLPKVSGEVSGKRAETSDNSYSYGITGQQLLFDGFKTSNDLEAASENIKAATYDHTATLSSVRLRLRTAFTELLKGQELISITKEITSRRRQNLDLVRLRYEAGREHKGSLSTAEANLAQAELELTQAERNLTLAQRHLIKELGRKDFTPITAEGDFTSTEVDKMRPDFEKLADNTPFLRELGARKEAASFKIGSSKGEFFPQVYLNGSLGKSDSVWPPEEEEWSAGISLSLPIFEGGKQMATLSRAKAEFNQAQADEKSGRDQVIFALEEAWTNFQDATDKIGVQRKYLGAAEERAKIARAQYSTGLISFDNWIIIEDKLVESKKTFLDSQANMLITEAKWIQAKGGVFENED